MKKFVDIRLAHPTLSNQGDLSRAAGVQRACISQIERQGVVSPDEAEALCRVLGVKPQEVFEFSHYVCFGGDGLYYV